MAPAGNSCDETTLEDEAGISPVLTFLPDGTIFFVSSIDGDLNDPEFTNTYTLIGNELTIQSHYQDGTDVLTFDAILTYDPIMMDFSGTYTFIWPDGFVCENDVSLYRP